MSLSQPPQSAPLTGPARFLIAPPWRRWVSDVWRALVELQTVVASLVATVATLVAKAESQVTASGTTAAINATDVPSGSVLRFTNGSAVTATLANTIPAGWSVRWRQVGAGQVTFAMASGGTLRNRQSHTKSAGQYAEGTLSCDSNAGTAAVVFLAGDTAA